MTEPAYEYIQARRTLLDALDALQSHRDSLVLIGAQAVYLHTGSTGLRVPPMTTGRMGDARAGIKKNTLPSPRISFGQRGLAGARSGHRPTSAQPPTRLPEELNACGQMHDRGQIPALARDDINSQLRRVELYDLPPGWRSRVVTLAMAHISFPRRFWAGLPPAQNRRPIVVSRRMTCIRRLPLHR